MDHHLLAIIEQSEDSDLSSDTKFPTVISGLSEIQVRRPVVNQANAKQFRPGVIRVGRHTGNPQHLGLIPVETSNQAQTTESVVSQPLRTGVSSAAQPSLGAVPRVQNQLRPLRRKGEYLKHLKNPKHPQQHLKKI